MSKKKIRISFIILIISFLFMSIGYSIVEESFSIDGTVNLKKDGEEEEEIAYELTVSLSKWQAGMYEYQYNPFNLTYQGTENTTSWNIVIDVPDDATLSACWNMNCVLENGILTLHSTSENNVIAPGAALTNFGFQMATSMDNYELNIKKVNFYTPARPNPYEREITEGINVTQTGGSGWNDGGMYVKQFNFTVSNDSGVDLNFWQLEIEKESVGSTMVNLWGCNYVETDEKFIITGLTNETGIKDGASRNFGLQVKVSNQDVLLTIIKVFGKGIVLES